MKNLLLIFALAGAVSAYAVHESTFGRNIDATAVGSGVGDNALSRDITAVGRSAAKNAYTSISDIFVGKESGVGVSNSTKVVAIGNNALGDARNVTNVVAIGNYELAGIEDVRNTTSINNGQIFVSETFDVAMIRPNSLKAPTNSPFAYIAGDTYIGGTGVVHFAGKELLYNGDPVGAAKTVPDENLNQTVSLSNDMGVVYTSYNSISHKLISADFRPKKTGLNSGWTSFALTQATTGSEYLYHRLPSDTSARYFTLEDAATWPHKCTYARNNILNEILINGTQEIHFYTNGGVKTSASVEISAEPGYETGFTLYESIPYNGKEMDYNGNIISNYSCRIVRMRLRQGEANVHISSGKTNTGDYSHGSMYIYLTFITDTGLELSPYWAGGGAGSYKYYYLEYGFTPTTGKQTSMLEEYSRPMELLVDGEISSTRYASTKMVYERCPFVFKKSGDRICVTDDNGQVIGFITLTSQ